MEAEPLTQAPAVEPSAPPSRVVRGGSVGGRRRGTEQARSTALPDLAAASCVVLHIPPTGRSLLAPILDRNGMLTTVPARNGAPLRPGTIFVAAIAVTQSTAVLPVGRSARSS